MHGSPGDDGGYWARGRRGGGGGVLSLEKDIECGLTAAELWLPRAKIAEKEGLSSVCIGSYQTCLYKGFTSNNNFMHSKLLQKQII